MMHAPANWTPDIAYLVGYITTDGSLSSDGRHITIVSKDRGHLEKLNCRFKIGVKIRHKCSGFNPNGLYYQITFGGVAFYRWLEVIGLMPRKSKKVGDLVIPKKYFADFLRGHLDGDGTIYSYFDPRWRSSYMVYICFLSASVRHLDWLQSKIRDYYGINPIFKSGVDVYKLEMAKKDSLRLISIVYPVKKDFLYLERKYVKVQQILADVAKLVDVYA